MLFLLAFGLILFVMTAFISFVTFSVGWSLPRLENKTHRYICLLVALLLPLLFQFTGLWIFPLSGFALGYGLPNQVSKKGRSVLLVIGVVLLIISIIGFVQLYQGIVDAYSY
ncbi:TPA: hypothetical protein U2C46_000996 [Streptococcus suis]|nr:hypothetical protein [Streptococcus suis]